MSLSTGTWTIAVRATDAAGNLSGWRSDTVRIDAGVPSMRGLRPSQTLVTTVDGRFTATWAAADNIGVTAYQYRFTRRPAGTASISHWTVAHQTTLRLAAGTWEFGVRARDAVGNISPWRTTLVSVPLDDRGFTFSAGTTRRAATAAFRGTLTTTSVKGARLTISSPDGTAFVLIGRVGRSYGKLRVTVDGRATIVDTGYLGTRRATTTHDRVLLFSVRLAAGPHHVTIENLATSGRRTIAIDGLGFLR